MGFREGRGLWATAGRCAHMDKCPKCQVHDRFWKTSKGKEQVNTPLLTFTTVPRWRGDVRMPANDTSLPSPPAYSHSP